MRRAGVWTFVFTDIEGSTRLVTRLGDAYEPLLDVHRALVRAAVAGHAGREVGTEGDSFFVAFERASDAVAACLDAQRAIEAHPWPSDARIRVRMGAHSGEAHLTDSDFVGLAVHHAARVAATAHGGQVVLSQATVSLVPALPDGAGLLDLGLHQLKDIDGLVHLHQLTHPELPAIFPPPRSVLALVDRLPLLHEDPIGRADALADIDAALDAARLVTIVGTGGVGKTTAAVAAARARIARHPGGVSFADLAPLADHGLVVATVATAMGIGTPMAGVSELVEQVGDRAALVVLDNCEHVVDEVADVVGVLLAGCRRLVVLATSREPLAVEGERLVPLAPLRRDAAVALFAARARLLDPGFVLDTEQQRTVELVCERLDDLPLAVELAAARTRSLSVGEILAALDDRLRFLKSDRRTGAARQLTLEGAIRWSYDLLAPDLRKVLGRLAAFPDGAPLDLARTVLAADDLDPLDIGDHLDALVARSLVDAERSETGTRYVLLESVRAFALRRLAEHGEAEATARRLLASVTAWCERLRPVIEGPDPARALARVAVEEAAIREAVEAARSQRLDAELVRVVAALGPLGLESAGVVQELATWLQAAMLVEGPVDPLARASVLLQATWTWAGEAGRVRPWVDEALALARAHGDRAFECLALTWRGDWQPDARAGAADFEAALALIDQGAPAVFAAVALNSRLSMALRRGDLDTADRLIAAHLGGDTTRYGLEEGKLLYQVGRMAMLRGDLDAAEHWYLAAEAAGRRTGSAGSSNYARFGLARLALARGDLDAARAWIEANLRLYERMERSELAGDALILVDVCLAQGDLERARAVVDQLGVGGPSPGDTSIRGSFAGHAHLAGAKVLEAEGRAVDARRAYLVALRLAAAVPVRGLCADALSGLARLEPDPGRAAAIAEAARAMAVLEVDAAGEVDAEAEVARLFP